MALVSDIEIRLRADIARLQQDMTRARQSVTGAVDTMRKSLLGLAAGFSLVEIGRQVVAAQREFDKLNSSLVTATGSTKAAGQAMKALQDFAARTPFSLQEVTDGFLKLRNLGLTPSERALESYGNTSAAMGKNLTQLVEAVADATTGEFERLKEFGIKAKQQGDFVSLTFQGTTTKIGNNAAEIEEYLTKIGEVNFAGGMARQANTLDGDLARLGDTWSQTLVAFSQSGFGDVVRSSVGALSESLEDLGAIFKAVTSEADEQGKKVDELNGVHFLLTTTFETLAVLGLNVAFAFKAVGRNIGAVAAAVANPTHAIEILRARFSDLGDEWDRVNADSDKVLKAAGAARAKAAAEQGKQTEDRLAGYKIQGDGAKGLSDTEIKAAAKAKQAYDELMSSLQARVDATAREVAGLVELTKSEQAHADLTEKIRLGKIKLTKEQERSARSLIDEASANESLARQNKEWSDLQDILVKNAQDLAQERYKLIDSAREEAEQNEFLVETFGMAEEAIIRLRAARLLEQEAQRLGRELTAEEIADLNRVIELKERSAEAVANRRQLEETKQYWTDIEKTARDTFVSIADGGKNAFQRLKDTAKNVFFDWLYQQTLKKWIINLQANGSSIASSVGSLFGGSGSSGGAGSLLSSIGSIFGKSSASTTAGGAGSFLGGAASYAGWIAAGMAIADGLFKKGWDPNNGSIQKSTWTVPIAQEALLFNKVFKAIGLNDKMANLFSGASIVSRIWGRKNPEIESQGIQGTIGAVGFSGQNFANVLEKGGLLRSNKRYIAAQALSDEQDASFDKIITSMVASVKGFGAALGLSTTAIDGYQKQIKLTLTKDEAENEKLIAELFAGVGDELAVALLPTISKFQAEGETAAMALERVAGNFSAVTEIMRMTGVNAEKAFNAVGIASLEARERLIALAGGVEALAAQTEYFNQNFLSQAEQIKIIQGPLNEQLAALGYAGITTTDQFKEAVQGLAESGKLATEEGAKTYAGLLALGPQFKTVADYLQGLNDAAAQAAITLANSKRDLEIEIMELSGDTLGALTARRAIERAAADESLRPLIDRIHALQDEKAAAEAATLALEKNEEALRRAVDTAFDALSRAVDAQREKVTSAYQDTMARISASIAAVNVRVSDLTSLSNALKGGLGTVESDAQQMASRGAARAQVQAAIAIAKSSGVLPTADDLKATLATLNRDASDQFSSLADYQREVARTNAELETLGGLTDKQLTDAQQQLRVLEDQKALAERQYEAEMAYLDGILEWAQAEVDAINGVDRTVQSVVAAIAGLKVAGAALGQGATPANPTGSNLTVEQLYRTVLGREGERAGIEFWKNAFGEVVDAEEYKQFILGATPELEMQDRRQREAAAAVPMSGTMSSSSASASAEEMKQMKTDMARTAIAVEQLASQFNQVSGGGNSLLTEPA